MFASMSRRSARIGPWPRRIAALICLLLAAASALSSQSHASAPLIAHGLSAQLRHGEVAVPVVVASANARVLHPGDLIGVLASPADSGDGTALPAVLVADHVRVLSIGGDATGLGSDSTTQLEIATSRVLAIGIARYAARPLMVIVDDPP